MYLRQDGNRIEYKKWNRENDNSWIKCSTEDQLYLDFLTQKESDNLLNEQISLKNKKINLKSKIIAGEALGLDMTEEINKLNELLN